MVDFLQMKTRNTYSPIPIYTSPHSDQTCFNVLVFIIAWIEIKCVVYSFELKIIKIIKIIYSLDIRRKGIIKNIEKHV
jgi:hypothetical protein